ncbi:site-specific recombinase XerD [Pontibacter ummariensis]|uniref:Site-specific recombinase XerD n=1 Tax=Pontibacter ummariensis TaxID=1610492 RepID=A0A239J321_9BACT|nr:site-specific integrase [Pontibacter ummariensis]PRY08866.1 site-specific recombinase XerD [Pontibacter ummariensis]SNT00436.1 Site-specific recombinase XerD [Pontibacter ummariensis]
MASTTFVLKEPTSKDETLVYMLFRFNNKRLKFSTGEKILPKFWNPEKQRAKETKQFPDYLEFNTRLDNCESAIKTVHRRLVNDKILPTVANLKEELLKELLDEEEQEGMTLFKFIEELIKTTSKRPNTIKNYKQAQARLTEYRTARKRKLDFEDINLDFYYDFTKYLQDKKYSVNSIAGFIRNIKVFMNEATDRGINKNLEYLNKRFKVVEEHADAVYLTQDELKKIYELDLSNNERLDRVRDLFIVGCYTGLRFSDLEYVTQENFIKDNTQIRLKTQKTGGVVVIPVHKFVKQIYDKYFGVLPTSISNQKMNDYIKEVAELAKIEDKVLISITKGGKREQSSHLKHELISTHTARRSFATNLYLADVPAITIMKITGHKTEKAFMKYIRLSQEENADKLINHPFFN